MSSLSVMELIKMFQKLFMLMLLPQFLQMLEMSRCKVVKIVSRLYVKLVQQSNKLCRELMEVIQLLIYTTVQSDFGDVNLANEEALEQSSLARGGVT